MSKVRRQENKLLSSMSTSLPPAVSSDVVNSKDMVSGIFLDRKNQNPASARKSGLKTSCVTCGGGHSYQNCPATTATVHDNIQTSTSGDGTLPTVTLLPPKEDLKGLLNENVSAVSSTRYQEKTTWDPGPISVPCELFGDYYIQRIGDLGASINSWLFLFGKADFVVVDFEPDPRVPLILGRCFLKTSHALIDVYEGEITLRVGKEAITFNLDQTSKYTADYDHMTANKIDVIDMACDEYSQEVLGFSNVIASGNPTPYFEPIVSTASPNLTPFGDSDFLLMEEADSFLALEDDPTSSEVDPTYQDPEGDICSLEAFCTPFEPPTPPQIMKQYMLECAKVTVIFAKDLKGEEKAALLKHRKDPIPLPLHGPNARKTSRERILLFPRGLSALLSDPN
ncbi:hypothetical protein Tco_0272070 [Tanacetum coccineum]